MVLKAMIRVRNARGDRGLEETLVMVRCLFECAEDDGTCVGRSETPGSRPRELNGKVFVLGRYVEDDDERRKCTERDWDLEWTLSEVR